MADQVGGVWLTRLFWVVAGGNLLLTVIALLQILAGHGSRYDALYAILLLGVGGIIGAIMLAFALAQSIVFRGVALAAMVWPLLQFGVPFAIDFLTPPIDYDHQPAHIHFSSATDGALADAIAAGDARKVAELAPNANLNAEHSAFDVTFMQLALGRARPYGPPKPDVVAALLKAGADPSQDAEFVFRIIVQQRDLALLRAAVDAGVDLNQLTYLDRPRFFMVLDWPEALAIVLDRGASTEAEDRAGRTAIVLAFEAGNWAGVDLLMAHGARFDHADRGGKTFRDAVQAVLDRYRRLGQDVPPRLLALESTMKS